MLELDYNKEKNIAALALVYAVIMFKRCHELSLLQRINSVLLADSDANTEVKNLGNLLVIKQTVLIYNTSVFSFFMP